MSSMPKKSEYDNSIFKSGEKFLKRFNVKKILKESNAAKDKGVSAYSIIAFPCNVMQSVDRLTSDARKTAFVIDDSPYYRNRSKKVAFLSHCYDHVEHKYYKGLTLLTLGWRDGQTFLPILFRLLGPGSDKNLLESSHIKEDTSFPD